MERRPALALATVGALMAAASTVAASSALLHRASTPEAVTPSSLVGPPAATDSGAAPGPVDPLVVTETRDVWDTVVVATGAPAAAPPTDQPADPSDPTPAPAKGTKPPAATTTTSPPQGASGSPTTTPSTVPSTTTTSRPPGVPADWPPGKPIPPMPAGCRQPQLEDNGVWNCDH